MNAPKVIDLFSGCGGLSEGFRQAGFKVRFLNDINPAALHTATSNHARAASYLGGIEALNGVSVTNAVGGEIDGIIGGPPCQGFSMANQHTRFLDNPKNSLFREYLRLVDELKPKFFVMENVEGLLSMDGGRVKDAILCSFQDVGYVVDFQVLSASDFGVPQHRTRVVFIGNRIGKTNVFPDPSGVSVSVGEAISDLPPIENGSVASPIPYSLAAKTSFQKEMRAGSDQLWNHIVTKHSDGAIERISHVSPGGNWKDIPVALLGDIKGRERTHSNRYRRLRGDKPSITICNFRKAMVLHPTANRILSVREAARLQSFPDSYIFEGKINQMQQQVSDAVPPLMAKAVASAVLETL